MVDFPGKEKYDLSDFRKLVEILRHEGGCPWDMEQTHESIRRNTLEEAYEVCGAIDEGDPVHLREELGDMLLHVLFHSSIEADAGRFDVDDVADAAVKKLVFRHPHVFGNEEAGSAEEVLDAWESIKEKERAQKLLSETMAGVTAALPSLWRAEKLQSKAERAGKSVPDAAAAAEKVREYAAEAEREDDAEAAVGELLYAAVELARKKGVDPETALHAACERVIEAQRSAESAEQ